MKDNSKLLRLKSSPILRDLCAETQFYSSQLIQPLFVVEALSKKEEIKGLIGNYRENTETLLIQIEKDYEKGLRNFLLFVEPNAKSEKNFKLDFAFSTIQKIRNQFGNNLHLWIDTCLCSQTQSGHCCLFSPQKQVDQESTLHELAVMAKTYAQAGAHGIAPSDMMDGRTKKIRETLDKEGYENLPIMSYSTKFASQFYGPFRKATDSTPQWGDRSQYQLDVRDGSQAIRASERCAKEGADLLMVKPGLSSLDLIKPIQEKTSLKVGAYQVSGEFAGMHLLAREKLIDFEKALWESWQVYKRAGAQFIISYGARFLVQALHTNRGSF